MLPLGCMPACCSLWLGVLSSNQHLAGRYCSQPLQHHIQVCKLELCTCYLEVHDDLVLLKHAKGVHSYSAHSLNYSLVSLFLFFLLAFLTHITCMLSAGPCVREGNFEMRVRRGMTSLTVYAWPNATVPYHISEQFSKYVVYSSQTISMITQFLMN